MSHEDAMSVLLLDYTFLRFKEFRSLEEQGVRVARGGGVGRIHRNSRIKRGKSALLPRE